MDSLIVSAENAYGIGHMNHLFKFLDKNGVRHRCIAIYAPNGTCKSSLRKSLEQWSKGLKPQDIFFSDRKTVFDLKTVPADSLKPERIFCFESMGKLEVSRFFDDSLLAAPELKARHLDVMQKHRQRLSDLLTMIRKEYVSGRGAPDLDGIQNLIIQEGGGNGINEALSLLLSRARSYRIPSCIEGKKSNEVLGRNPDVLDKPEIKGALTDFAATRNKVVAESPYLTDQFDYPAAESLAAELEKSGFFDAGHSITLHDSNTGDAKEITSAKEFKDLLTSQLERANRDPGVQEKYRAVEKAFGKTKAAVQLKNLACGDPDMASALSDPPELRRAFLLKAILRCEASIEAYLSAAQQYEQDMKAISIEVNRERTEWDRAVDLFNARFSLPFRPYIKNRANSLIGGDEPAIAFKYDDRDVPNETLLNYLSEGERKALYMLQIIFEVEKAKNTEGDKLLVFDDVVDSFDYANKYAFIEYLRDFASDDSIYVLLLTHNYDFYRTVASRLGNQFSRSNCLHAERDDSRTLQFDSDDYLRQNLLNKWKGNLTDSTTRIATIPMVRELVSIREGNSSPEYALLSDVLHGRTEAEAISFDDLSSVYVKHWGVTDLAGDSRVVVDTALQECDRIVRKAGFLKLQDKIVLSIGIRILMERHIAQLYLSRGAQVPRNKQFGSLAQQFKQDFPNEYSGMEDIVERTCLIVPENIHANSFMYEPLVDIGSSAFVRLYQDVRTESGTKS